MTKKSYDEMSRAFLRRRSRSEPVFMGEARAEILKQVRSSSGSGARARSCCRSRPKNGPAPQQNTEVITNVLMIKISILQDHSDLEMFRGYAKSIGQKICDYKYVQMFGGHSDETTEVRKVQTAQLSTSVPI